MQFYNKLALSPSFSSTVNELLPFLFVFIVGASVDKKTMTMGLPSNFHQDANKSD